MANSDNKTTNWLNRLRRLSIRRTPEVSSNNENEDFATVVFQRQTPPSNSDTATCPRTRNSFRKSLRKMHTRVKTVFANSSASARHTIHVSSTRVTLNSSTPRVENIYSVEPIKKCANQSIGEEPILESPSRSANQSIAEEPLVESPSGEANNHDFLSNWYGNLISEEEDRETGRNFPQLPEIPKFPNVPKVEVISLANCYWYWGPITRTQAEDKLRNFPEGAFLIRDSSSDRHIFTMSFRCVGKTLHTRIELNKNGYSLFNQGGYHSVTQLVDDALSKSKKGVYCYTKSTDEISPNYPIRLILPVSRYDKVASLKHLSAFVIRQCINLNDIERLPLPRCLHLYLKEDSSYF